MVSWSVTQVDIPVTHWLTFQIRQQDVETQPERWEGLADASMSLRGTVMGSPDSETA